MKDTVIFDLDGTILNTTLGVIEASKYAMREMGIQELAEEEFSGFIACSPLKECFKQYCHVDEQTANECCILYKKHFKENAHKYTKVYDGVIELLEYLKNNSYKTAVATYKDEQNAKKILSHFELDKYFGTVRGADAEGTLTKKDIILKCMEELSANKEDALYIGDTLSDAKASAAAGLEFLAVTYGFGFKTEKDLNESNCIKAIDSPEKTTEFLRSYLGKGMANV